MKYIELLDPICVLQSGFNRVMYQKGDTLEVLEEKDGYYLLLGAQGTKTSVRIRDKEQYYIVHDKHMYKVVNRLLYGGIDTNQVFTQQELEGYLEVNIKDLDSDFDANLVSFRQEILIL